MTSAQPARRASGLFISVVVVLLAALAVEAFVLLRSPKLVRPEEAQRAIASASNQVTTFGQRSAPIKIEFFAPLTLEWHQKTIGLLRQYDQAHPGRIHVTLMPMGNPDCNAQVEKRGYTCAVIFVNGKTEFALPSGKAVTFEKKPNTADSRYNSEDVITVVDQLWRQRSR
jgi:hypothetical protein